MPSPLEELLKKNAQKASLVVDNIQTEKNLVLDPEAANTMLFNTMVIYGPTGSRKTSQIGEFAKYIYEKTGKVTRLISMDGGGWGPVQDLINGGIIEAWRLTQEERPDLAIINASKGMWPDKLVNGLRVGSCTLPNPGDRGKFLNNVGAFAVEGWTSIADAIMRNSVSKGRKINEDVVSKYEETDKELGGTLTFGAPSRGHYGFAQSFIKDMIRNFSSLPVERILYTALEGKGEDRMTKTLQYGPQVAGNAITASIPQYVGDCLHFEDYTIEKGTDPENPKQKLVETKVRAWFTSHPDPQTGVMWPAKPRLIPSKVEEFKKIMGKNGYFILEGDSSLKKYLQVQDELLADSINSAAAWKAKIDASRKAS